MMKTQHQQPNYQNNEDDFDSVWVPNPHGLKDSAATHGLINSIKSGSLDSLLTNPWLMSIFVATVILVVIAVIATVLSGQRSTEINPSQEAYSEMKAKVSKFRCRR